MKKVGVALLGLGTVGGGTYTILTNNYKNIKDNYGVDIEVRHIIDKDKSKAEKLGYNLNQVSCDINNVINDPDIDIVAEFFGGIEPAKSYLIKCLHAGKSIVTANKEMFSKHWHELEVAAKKGKAGLYFEASCVGGVPIIRTLIECMQGNKIQLLMGIVNGTTNYILSKMTDENMAYDDALKKAQRLGYAEADPTADVDGYDSMYKLSILSSLAFHTKVPIDKIYREGISHIDKLDIEFGKKFGYTLKLLAIGKKVNGKIEARVHPAFILNDHPLASVKDSFNAVHLVGDNVGDIMLYGRGAGALPTGSAIVSDIVYAANTKQHKYASFENTTDIISNTKFSQDFQCEYYIRMTVNDIPGVVASISTKLAEYQISINSIQQQVNGDKAALIFMLHATSEKKVKEAITKIKDIESVFSVDTIIRVES